MFLCLVKSAENGAFQLVHIFIEECASVYGRIGVKVFNELGHYAVQAGFDYILCVDNVVPVKQCLKPINGFFDASFDIAEYGFYGGHDVSDRIDRKMQDLVQATCELHCESNYSVFDFHDDVEHLQGILFNSVLNVMRELTQIVPKARGTHICQLLSSDAPLTRSPIRIDGQS